MTIDYYAPSAISDNWSFPCPSHLEERIIKVDKYIETLFSEANCYLAERLLSDIYSRSEDTTGGGPLSLSSSWPLTNVTCISDRGPSFASLGELHHTMSLLMDSHTRLLALDLFQQEGSTLTFPALMMRLGAVLGLSQPPLDVSELREALLTTAVESLLIVVVGAQGLSTTCFSRADHLMRSACQGTKCRVHWLLDDISMLARLALPMQANIALHRVTGRSPDDTLIDIISGLLSHAQVLPGDRFLEALKARLEQGVSVPELRLFLKLSLLEHFTGRPRTPDEFLKLASVRQELETMSNPGESTVGEIGMALATDAEVALGKIAWTWTILTTIRSLWGEELCPAVDLLRRPPTQAAFTLSHWSMRIVAKGRDTLATEEMKDLRQMQLFKRALVARGSNTLPTKELLAILPSTDLEVFLQVLGEFVNSHQSTNVCILLEEFCQLLPGQVTTKLLTPRLLEVLQMALEHPEFYQQGRVSSEPSEEVSPSDTAIVFRLAGECGKFINTCDWYISYRQSADPKRSQAPTKKRKEHYERLVIVRRTF